MKRTGLGLGLKVTVGFIEHWHLFYILDFHTKTNLDSEGPNKFRNILFLKKKNKKFFLVENGLNRI